MRTHTSAASAKLLSGLTVFRVPFLKWFIHSSFLASFFPLPSSFPPLRHFPGPSPRSVTGSLPQLFADSAQEFILHSGNRTFAATKRVKGRSWHQEDGGLSNCQSENNGGSSFHPFVCSQTVFSPVKTKFNLHPFTHCFSVPSSHHPALLLKLFSASALPLKLFPLPSLAFLSHIFLILSHHSVTHSSSSTHTHTHILHTQKPLLRFTGLRHSCLSESLFVFKSVITSVIEPNAVSLPNFPLCQRKK